VIKSLIGYQWLEAKAVRSPCGRLLSASTKTGQVFTLPDDFLEGVGNSPGHKNPGDGVKYLAIIADGRGFGLELGDATPAANSPFHHPTEFTVSCDCRIPLPEPYSKLPGLVVEGFSDNW